MFGLMFAAGLGVVSFWGVHRFYRKHPEKFPPRTLVLATAVSAALGFAGLWMLPGALGLAVMAAAVGQGAAAVAFSMQDEAYALPGPTAS